MKTETPFSKIKQVGRDLTIILGFFGSLTLGAATCLDKVKRSEENPRLIVFPTYNTERIEKLSYSYGLEKVYVDTVPLGSLDYVIEHASEKRIERKPASEEYETFRKMGAESK